VTVQEAGHAGDLRQTTHFSGGDYRWDGNNRIWSTERVAPSGIPSGKLSHNYGKSPFFIGKFTISMAIFNSYVWQLPEGMSCDFLFIDFGEFTELTELTQLTQLPAEDFVRSDRRRASLWQSLNKPMNVCDKIVQRPRFRGFISYVLGENKLRWYGHKVSWFQAWSSIREATSWGWEILIPFDCLTRAFRGGKVQDGGTCDITAAYEYRVICTHAEGNWSLQAEIRSFLTLEQ